MARRKKKSARTLIKARQPRQKLTGLFVAITATVIFAAIPFSLGKYIEFHSPGPFDSGAYVYSAKHLLSGARLGIEEKPSAGLGTLIANIIGVKLFGFNDTGPKVVQMVLQLAAGIFMFYTLRRVFGSLSAIIATSVAAVCLSAPVIAKFGNVKEQFMIAFMMYAGCCLILYEFTSKRFWLVLAGFFALQPFYFKPTGISIVIAIVLYMLGRNLFSRKWKTLCLELLLFLCGYAAGLMIPGSLLLWQKKPESLLRSFPVTALQAGAGFVIFLLLLIYGGFYLRKLVQSNTLKKVSKRVWITGLVLIILAFGLSLFMIQRTPGYLPGDTASYISHIPFVSVPNTLIVFFKQKLFQIIGLKSGYLAESWAAVELADVAQKIGRYYMALKLPILLAFISIITAKIVWMKQLFKKTTPQNSQSKIVWFLTLWWLLDTAFVWVSPRSYEQYYLPLCASAAMLSAYAVWLWQQKFSAAQNKMPWLAAAAIAAVIMLSFSWNIFAGFPKSPDTGFAYKNRSGQPERRRGFAQSLARVKADDPQPWQTIGSYIHTHSSENDTLYVWGWVPGIYVQAQRLAPVPRAFEGNMHVTPPAQLDRKIRSLVEKLRRQPPKFIADSRKRHIPWNRPPLELWPTVPAKMFGNKNARPLKNDEQEIATFDKVYMNFLEKSVNKDEAMRYQAMKPFRQFVMTYYKPVIRRQFGTHGLYERAEQVEQQKP